MVVISLVTACISMHPRIHASLHPCIDPSIHPCMYASKSVPLSFTKWLPQRRDSEVSHLLETNCHGWERLPSGTSSVRNYSKKRGKTQKTIKNRQKTKKSREKYRWWYLGRPLGTFWSLLGALPPFSGALGTPLGALGTLLGRSWALLGVSWTPPGRLLDAT